MDGVLDLFKVLFEPTAVFERVREKPKFLGPLLVLLLITVVVGVAQLPYVRAAISAQVAQTPNATPQQAETAMKFAPIGVVIAPIVYTIFLVIGTLVLWVSVSVLGGEGKFSLLLSVATYAAFTYSLLQVVGLLVLLMRGTSAVAGVADLQPALGLDLLVPDAKGFGLAFLRGINPFTLYGLFLTATGIAVTHRTSKATAYGAASAQFLLALLLGAALARG